MQRSSRMVHLPPRPVALLWPPGASSHPPGSFRAQRLPLEGGTGHEPAQRLRAGPGHSISRNQGNRGMPSWTGAAANWILCGAAPAAGLWFYGRVRFSVRQDPQE